MEILFCLIHAKKLVCGWVVPLEISEGSHERIDVRGKKIRMLNTDIALKKLSFVIKKYVWNLWNSRS